MYQSAFSLCRTPRAFARAVAISVSVLMVCAPAARAQDSAEVILTVSGAVTATGADADFDMAELRALPAISFETTTTWTEGVTRFTGVPLAALLDAAGATGTVIEAIALNNYSVSIPVDSLDRDTPIIAYEMDGATFSRRDKGPLWIVYPYDESERYRNELIYGRSIWQLRTLSVK